MAELVIRTERLRLELRTREETIAAIEAMSPADRAQISADWLARVRASTGADPWTLGFTVVHGGSGAGIGSCGFKGPPDGDGAVEIAYGIDAEHRGKGYATEAAAALVGFALGDPGVRIVRAHTLPDPSASTRVLTKCGFRRIGEVIDPEDGRVWRWERGRRAAVESTDAAGAGRAVGAGRGAPPPTCDNCHAESRELWAIGPPYPRWERAAEGNFVALARCPVCGQLWLESYYEPHAAFRYAVQWPGDVQLFEAVRDRDESLTLCQWHEAQVQWMGNGADEATLARIRAHHERSRGREDLRPSRAPNPIDLGIPDASGDEEDRS